MHTVKDGIRELQFEGTLLSKSSSRVRHSTRWIEFELYKTVNSSYILSRIGVSLVYHGAACPLVSRYGLNELAFNDLMDDSIPCQECQPSESAGLVFPEKYRYWAQVSEEPVAVLDALYKYDDNGAKYLTNVAKRLLEEASTTDLKIAEIYMTERIL